MSEHSFLIFSSFSLSLHLPTSYVVVCPLFISTASRAPGQETRIGLLFVSEAPIQEWLTLTPHSQGTTHPHTTPAQWKSHTNIVDAIMFFFTEFENIVQVSMKQQNFELQTMNIHKLLSLTVQV